MCVCVSVCVCVCVSVPLDVCKQVASLVNVSPSPLPPSVSLSFSAVVWLRCLVLRISIRPGLDQSHMMHRAWRSHDQLSEHRTQMPARDGDVND